MNKKSKLTFLLLAVLSLSLLFAGCAGDVEKQPDTAPADDSEQAPDETTDEQIKVGLIAGLTGFGDKSMNDQALLGCEQAKEEFGIELKVLEPKDQTQVLDIMQNLIDEDYDLIISAVPDYESILQELAPNAPDTQFVIVDSLYQDENVMCVEYLTHQGSYVAGAAAAIKSETGVVGCVGGMDLPVISRFMVGFEEGAKSVNPDIEVICKYVGNTYEAWGDTTTAKSITRDMISNNCDVVFQIAGGAGLGVIDGAKEGEIWAVGVNVDQEEIAPDTVLTSMLTRGEVAVYDAIKKVVNGEKVGGLYQADLANNGVGIVYSRHFSEDETAQLQQIAADIIDGKIEVTDFLAAE